MKKSLLTGLIVVIVVVGAIVAFNLVSGQEDPIIVYDFETNEYTDQVSSKIDAMQAQKWDQGKVTYKNILFQINSYKGNDLITEEAASGLSQLLDNTYIKQLKDTAYNYCLRARNIKKWDDINDELEHYEKLDAPTVDEAIAWMKNYRSAYYTVYGAIKYAKNSERSDEEIEKFTKRFESYNKRPASLNTWLYSGSNSKVKQAKSDLINQFRAAERYEAWELQLRQVLDTKDYASMSGTEVAKVAADIKAWQSICDCSQLSKLIDNKFYNDSCDSLVNVAQKQIALINQL